MIFNHQLLPFEKLKTIEIEGVRHYNTPIGPLPSVTTVLKGTTNTKYLDEWRARVGKEKADGISLAATNRGDAVHKIAENYMMNRGLKGFPINLEMFRTIKVSLDRHITKVFGCELTLWSEKLKTAGTADLVAEWDGINAICDYKTSIRPVNIHGETLSSYRLQATAYSMMIEERYPHLSVPLCCILLMSDHEKGRVYKFENEQYREKVRTIFERR